VGRVKDILSKLDALYADPKSELHHRSDFELLISVILSAQATDAAVNRVTGKLFQQYPTAKAMSKAPQASLEAVLRPLGLYKNKARNIKKTCRILQETHGGDVPRQQTALEALPGVGRKTANVVLSAFGIPRIAVDTHVARVSKRLKLAEWEDSPRTVEKKLMDALPKSRWTRTHHQMILFGRYRCRSRKPACGGCPLKPWCRYPDI